MDTSQNQKSRGYLFYVYTGLVFLFWENLISSIFGLYEFEVRRTIWGVLYYTALFLAIGGMVEGFTYFYAKIFRSLAWKHQQYIWYLTALVALIWGGLSRQFLIDVAGVSPGRTSYIVNLLVIISIGFVGLAANLWIARKDKAGNSPDRRRILIIFSVILLYSIISVKVTTIFFSESAFVLKNILLQPVQFVFALGVISMLSRLFRSGRSFLSALVWLPLCLTIGFVGIAKIQVALSSHNKVQTAKSEKPNIIIMLFDTLRPDHVNGLVEGQELTPTINKLAENGKSYTHCYSTSSWTFPATVSLLTSRYPNEIGFLDNAVLPAELPTMMDTLRAKGYYTAGLSANFHIIPRYGFDRIFDRFYYEPGSGPKQMFLPFRTFFPSPLWIDELAYQFGFISTDLLSSDWEIMNREAFDVMDEVSSGPFFIYMHFIEPHSPYYSSKFDNGILDFEQIAFFYDYEFSRMDRVDFFQGLDGEVRKRAVDTQHRRYMDGARNADRAVAQMLQTLQQKGLTENTILIITADHGEEFLEHGNMGHKKSLFQELITIPLVIHIPEQLSIKLAERKSSVSILDIGPTVLDLAGTPRGIPDADGESLLQPSLNDARPKYSMVSERRNFWSSIVSEPYKLIIKEEMNLGTIDTLFFNLETDPGELNNIYSQNAALADSLAKILQIQMDQTIESPSEPSRGLTTAEKERLRALGYTQ